MKCTNCKTTLEKGKTSTHYKSRRVCQKCYYLLTNKVDPKWGLAWLKPSIKIPGTLK